MKIHGLKLPWEHKLHHKKEALKREDYIYIYDIHIYYLNNVMYIYIYVSVLLATSVLW